MKLLIGTIVCLGAALWVVSDATKRGISGLPWALLTFFVPIIGLPLYLIARPKGTLVTCIECGQKRLDSLKRCPYCGSNAHLVRDRVCRSCGKELKEGWEHCPYCGKKRD